MAKSKSDRVLAKLARKHAEEAVESADLGDIIDLDKVTWKVSGRMKKTGGKIRVWFDDGEVDRAEIKLARDAFHEWDTETWFDAVDHELAHLADYEVRGRLAGDHGDSFEMWCRRLDVEHVKGCPRFKDPKFIVECQLCGLQYERHVKSKLVKNPDKYACSECGGSLKAKVA